MYITESEQHLLRQLRDAPRQHEFKYTLEARASLLRDLFLALSNNNPEYIRLLFPNGLPTGIEPESWVLSTAQGAVEGAEYSAAARGKPCGHIFKAGEATYRCKTCSLDDTCVLCSKCYAASDHEGHAVTVYVSGGNCGCCDCGDPEAWQREVKCAIHTDYATAEGDSDMDMDHKSSPLPEDFVQSIRSTIGRALDYICDVISCSPEQLRIPKTEKTVREDEEGARLVAGYYGAEQGADNMEYCVVLWNDEKHTVDDVEHQVARACKQTKAFGKSRAEETDFIGRSIIKYSSDLPHLLKVARIVEQIGVTTTVRSARDTYREQMCGTIIEWLEDISGCSAGEDHNILRRTVCEELLGVWRVGSNASNIQIGKEGIDDHSAQEEVEFVSQRRIVPVTLPTVAMDIDTGGDMEDEEQGDEDPEGEPLAGEDDAQDGGDGDEGDDDDVDMVGGGGAAEPDEEGNGIVLQPGTFTFEDLLFVAEPRPRPVQQDLNPETRRVPHDRGNEEEGLLPIPKTPHVPKDTDQNTASAPGYWVEKPSGYHHTEGVPPYENLKKRVRLDWLIMFDLRLWKKARTNLRDLYISTVVAIPEFKRILGLRFAGLYTTLSELYLVADREPDHSIINLSLQMLTTPTITAEVVQKGNFLTNLMAILYTFLTKRQVSRPEGVDPKAVLAFDGAGTNPLTNRRMFHFFHDLKYLLVSTHVQKMIRDEPRYTRQFLDLVKLHQGICPNVRAIAEHVEFEADTWLSAAMVTREMNKFARLFAEAFVLPGHKFDETLRRAISYTAAYATVSSMGWEQHRAAQTENKSVTTFKRHGGYVLDSDMWGEPNTYKVVRFSVDKDPISFHHALHYTLSWMIEAGKSMSAEELRQNVKKDMETLAQYYSPTVPYDVDDLALAMFDIPLRVCVWLGQQKTNMWVRNGFSLRHQMQSYRGVSLRELTHQRDIFLIQTALITLNPSRFLANMIDRFNLHGWMTGDYSPPEGYEAGHIVDIAEEFLHLLIIVLSERLMLIPYDEEPELPILRIKREIIHVLCFKPLQFSELSKMLTERIQEHPQFQTVLKDLTTFRAPDGLSDYGTFELKPEYLDEVDPYILHFSKNQREETEAAYRARLAKKTGQKEDDVTFVPQLRPIKTGAFAGLAAFTTTPLFAHIIFYSLLYALQHAETASGISNTRTEIYLQLCLHLCQLAVLEDKCDEQHPEQNSFVMHALQKHGPGGPPIDNSSDADSRNTVATLLAHIFKHESLKAARPKVLHVLRSIRQKQPALFDSNTFLATALGDSAIADGVDAEKLAAERKKQLAKERQARIMAQMKAQQQSFIDTSGMDFEDDEFSDTEEAQEEHHTQWKYPTGTCILCQEEMNDSKLFGTLAFVGESHILRLTDVQDTDYLYEVAATPESLDRDAKDIRPFGVASMNKVLYKKLTADGSEITVQRQTLGRGFPRGHARTGPVIVGCTHLMHYGCFEQYCESTRRRQPSQIARNHPENIEKKEFVCPLCKALGNTFLPIIWKSKKETPASAMVPEQEFDQWLQHLGLSLARVRSNHSSGSSNDKGSVSECLGVLKEYATQNIVPGISDNMFTRKLTMPAPLLPMNISSWGTPLANTQHPPPTLVATYQQSQSYLSMAGSSNPPPPPVQYDELYAAYQRLKETYRVNDIPANYTSPSELFSDKRELDVTGYETLAKTLGFSISSVEIAQRGIASDIGATLLDRVSPQTLTLLRIYSETISSYIAVSILRSRDRDTLVLKLKDIERQYMHRLFLGDSFIDDEACRAFTEKSEPLLAQDMFVFCTEFVMCALPSMGWDPMHIIRLCYVAELVKAVLVVEQDADLSNNLQQWENAERLGYLEARVAYTEQQLDFFQRFAKLVGCYMDLPESFADLSSFSLAVFRQLVRAYATPFLRKTVILMHTRFGILFPPCDFAEADRPEEERLARMLKLPTLDEIFETILSDTAEGHHLRTLMRAWCSHASLQKTKLRISHPAIFELVGLPRDYDVLIEEATKRKCPTTGKDITDPNICLFCGAIFCGQSVCCRDEERRGGCNRHNRQCGGNVGIFINVRRCSLLFLHSENGSFVETPYMDAHGETDHGLKRNRQLYLNQKRYDALVRNVWLNHGIPTLISRKLEAELNTGGWDTF